MLLRSTLILTAILAPINAVLVYFFANPEPMGIVEAILFTFVLSYLLLVLYKRKSWIITSLVGILFPVIGALLLGIWWQATFSWDVTYRPPWYWTFISYIAWYMLLVSPFVLALAIFIGLRRRKSN